MLITNIAVYLTFVLLAVFLFHIASRTMGNERSNATLDRFLAADKNVKYGFIASSVLVSWTWTLTIVGAAEAGMIYGVSGGVSYTLGAIVPFFIFIPIAIRLKRILPTGYAYTEFIIKRYGYMTHNVLFIFAVLVVLYIFIEQLVGVALVFNNVFNFSFKVTVFMVATIVTACITRGGIRGAFNNNLFIFAAIFLLFALVCFALARSMDVTFIYNGLAQASHDPSLKSYNPQLLMLNSIAGLKYGIIAIIVAFGQVLLNQGYYSIAVAAGNDRSLTWGFMVGAIFAWMPIPIICANMFGHAAIALHLEQGHGINIATDIATYILMEYCGPFPATLFALMILLIAISAGSNCLVGIQALFIADFYKNNLKLESSDADKIRFGRIITVCFGALCAFIAIALDGISLLSIDMFSGIFFAAPCSALVAGLYMKKINEAAALISIFAGLIAGIGTWIFGSSPNSWFYGCIISLLLPAAIILILSTFIRKEFNFLKLQF